MMSVLFEGDLKQIPLLLASLYFAQFYTEHSIPIKHGHQPEANIAPSLQVLVAELKKLSRIHQQSYEFLRWEETVLSNLDKSIKFDMHW